MFREKSKFEFFRRKKTITIQIGAPIYPDKNLTVREDAEQMKEKCQKYYNDTVCDFYGYDKTTYSIYKTPEKKSNKVLDIDANVSSINKDIER